MRNVIWIGLLIAIGVAILLSPFASKSPDGLERVAEDKGFLEKGEGPPVLASPAPDYTMPGVKSKWLSTPIAGVLGTLLTFATACGLGRLLRWRRGRLEGGS